MTFLQRWNPFLTRPAFFSLLLASLLKVCLSQSCDFVTCNGACLNWESANGFCHNDYQPWDSTISCLCEYPYHGVTPNALAADLNQCVACNMGGVGPNLLSYYQIWTLICDTYATYGEQAAVKVAGSSDAANIQAFSASALPAITASYCGRAAVMTSTSTSHQSPSSSISSSISVSPVPIPSSGTSSVDTPSPATTTGSAINTASSSTSTPTHNSAARAGLSIMQVTIASSLRDILVLIVVGTGFLIIIF